MTEHILLLTVWLGFGFIALFVSGFIAAVISAVIMQYAPDSKLSRWLEGVWFDAPDVTSYNSGECINGDKWRNK